MSNLFSEKRGGDDMQSVWATVLLALSLACFGKADAQDRRDQWILDHFGTIEPHFSIDPIQIDNLLVLGTQDDPSEISLASHFYPTNGTPDFLILKLSTIDYYIRPYVLSSDAAYFGPKVGDPTGVYRFELRRIGDPECQSYETAMSASKKKYRTPGPFQRPAPSGQCIVYRYIGPLGDISNRYVYLDYIASGTPRSLGFSLQIREIRLGHDKVVARQVVCEARPYDRPPPARCFNQPLPLIALVGPERR